MRFLWLKIKLIAYKARNMRRHEKGFCCYTIQQLDIILGSISISVTLRKSSAAQNDFTTFDMILSNHPFHFVRKRSAAQTFLTICISFEMILSNHPFLFIYSLGSESIFVTLCTEEIISCSDCFHVF